MASGRYTIRKIDENQPEIVKALRACGFAVALLHAVGGRVPDLVCSRSNITFLAEVKNPDQAKSDRQLTRDQKVFHDNWKAEIPILETTDDVLRLNARFASMGKVPQ